MRTARIEIAAALATAALTAAICGCESSDDNNHASWNSGSSSSSSSTASSSSPSSGASSSSSSSSTPASGSTTGTDAYADAVDFGSLKWKYGGISAGGAVHSGVNISGLNFGSNSLSFHYVNDLSAWGLSHNEAGAICCLFVQLADGSWVGGKFDWISSSRTSRDLTHCRSYNGWTLNGVPNPCQAAFVIVNSNKKTRSNVLVGTWSR